MSCKILKNLGITLLIEHLEFLQIYDIVDFKKPFKYVAAFAWPANTTITRINNSFPIRETHANIVEYLTNQKINFGILMLAESLVIFTEQKLNFNPLIIKLSTGINLIGKQQFNLSSWVNKMNLNNYYSITSCGDI